MVSPELTLAAGSPIVRAPILTWPARISAFKRERDSAGIRTASTRSSRPPVSSAEMVTVSMADMVQPMPDDHKPLDPEAAAAIGKVRRLMIIIMTTTFVAVGVILAVIGYRLSQVKESAPSFVDVTHALPPGAKVLSTAIGSDHIVVTIEVGGAVQLLTFDPDTLQPLGRLRFEQKP